MTGCGDEDSPPEVRKFTVTCADMDDPAAEPLKKWTGESDIRGTLDLSLIIGLDSSKGGAVLYDGDKYHMVSMDINSTEPEADVTIWYRKHTHDIPYRLTVQYQGFPDESQIREDISLDNVPGGQTVDDDFLNDSELLPEVEDYVYDHFVFGDIVMGESATITAWYYQLYKVTLVYVAGYPSTEILPRRVYLLKHGVPLTQELLVRDGYIEDLDGYRSYYAYIDDKFVTDDIEIEIGYF